MNERANYYLAIVAGLEEGQTTTVRLIEDPIMHLNQPCSATSL